MRPHNSSAVTCVFSTVLFLLVTFPLVAPTSAQTVAAPTDKTIEVIPSQKWVDSGIDLHPGDLVQVSASSTGSGDQLCDPQGLMSLANAGKLPLDSALPGALLAKLQEKATTPVFLGAERQLKITEAGRLYLGANLGGSASCSGAYSVKIRVTPGEANQAATMQSKLASAAQI
jgi:hypothetical protein